MKRSLSLILLVLACLFLATAALAANRQLVIIVVDRDSGTALVPDGTPLPVGITIHAADGSLLPFANAPEERFTSARRTVALTHGMMPSIPFVLRDRSVPGTLAKTADGRFVARSNVEDSDVTYYVNFYDGSYISARRVVDDISPNGVLYLVQTAGYTPENDYYDGWISVDQSSEATGFNTSAYCTIGSTGGYCSTGLYGYQAFGWFCAHVTASGNIHHRRLPICGRYGEPPCSENLSGSIEIDFP